MDPPVVTMKIHIKRQGERVFVFIEHSRFSLIMGLYMHTDSVRFDLMNGH